MDASLAAKLSKRLLLGAGGRVVRLSGRCRQHHRPCSKRRTYVKVPAATFIAENGRQTSIHTNTVSVSEASTPFGQSTVHQESRESCTVAALIAASHKRATQSGVKGTPRWLPSFEQVQCHVRVTNGMRADVGRRGGSLRPDWTCDPLPHPDPAGVGGRACSGSDLIDGGFIGLIRPSECAQQKKRNRGEQPYLMENDPLTPGTRGVNTAAAASAALRRGLRLTEQPYHRSLRSMINSGPQLIVGSGPFGVFPAFHVLCTSSASCSSTGDHV